MHRENFPNATPETLIEKSPATSEYNCIAWTLGEEHLWWDTVPGYFWPRRIPKPASVIQNVVEMYNAQGFIECQSADLEPGIEKIVLYSESGKFRHAAFQLESGRWTSKMGPYEDVVHSTAETLLGDELEKIERIMMRPRTENHKGLQ